MREQPALQITLPKTKSKISASVWGALDEFLIFGHDDGMLSQYDSSSGEEVIVRHDYHKQRIHDLQLSKDQTMLITASKDTYAKVSQDNQTHHGYDSTDYIIPLIRRVYSCL